MIRISFLVLFVALCISARIGYALDGRYTVRGSIVTNQNLEDLSELDSRTKVIVNGGEYVGYIRTDGSFAIHNVPAGESLLEVVSPNFEFPKIRLDITSKDGKAIVAPRFTQQGHEWTPNVPTVDYPLVLSALGKYEFIIPREGFNVIGMLMNPYMMMVGFSLIMIFVLPKLQANMDPEALETSNKQYQNMAQTDISESITNFLMGGKPEQPKPSKKSDSSKRSSKR
ncbi:hypothetical protein H4219_000631 [Mycoemilia scoparia]|uniref:ER membrane protein complex subunit 7 beta-sandwich domain-containing protein n=1 Tax=Mycoemilia scoparia TaxID=417184 RepID=A0A9W8DWI3_9FUNG|nr:hypothetical protein H4219_000631 [Mycoemilia scoparia]